MTTALIAGATGMLGNRIAHHLAAEPGVAIRLLMRDSSRSDPNRSAALTPLLEAGAQIVVGDLNEPASLVDATAGVDVVVSAVQGREDIIIDGQVALANAAERSGVGRFVPSDFALDLFHAPPGAPQFAQRREADRQIDQLGLDVVHPLSGGFMDGILDPRSNNLVDVDTDTVMFFGTGDEPFDLTTVDDTARFTARLAVDPEVAGGIYAFSGARTTANQLAAELEEVTGRPFTFKSAGTRERLQSMIDGHDDPWAAMMLWYVRSMISTPPFEHVVNDRYPDIHLTTLREHLEANYANADEG